ncbi:MAG: hypothetical protein IJF00_00130 [Bacteroidaceae bacterium]|nr:hypothetical protein [Bacteroidaceae bacterium]
MISIIGSLIGAAVWGLIISLAVAFILFFIIKLFDDFHATSPISLITYLLLIIFLTFQCTLAVGASYAKEYTEGIGEIVTTIIAETSQGINNSISNIEASANTILENEKLNEAISEHYPMIEYILGDISTEIISGSNYATLAEQIVANVNKMINSYIVRRILWMAGAIAVASAVILFTRPKRRSFSLDDDDLYSTDY